MFFQGVGDINLNVLILNISEFPDTNEIWFRNCNLTQKQLNPFTTTMIPTIVRKQQREIHKRNKKMEISTSLKHVLFNFTIRDSGTNTIMLEYFKQKYFQIDEYIREASKRNRYQC